MKSFKCCEVLTYVFHKLFALYSVSDVYFNQIIQPIST